MSEQMVTETSKLQARLRADEYSFATWRKARHEAADRLDAQEARIAELDSECDALILNLQSVVKRSENLLKERDAATKRIAELEAENDRLKQSFEDQLLQNVCEALGEPKP